jgi:hypothetical protein
MARSKNPLSRLRVVCPGCLQPREVRAADWALRKSDDCGSCDRRRRAGLSPSADESGKGTRLYNIWRGMRQRCGHFGGGHAHDVAAYRNRGIAVCDPWRLAFAPFKEWAEANGYLDSLVLDRIDNDAGYGPHNCRWVTVQENNRHKRTTMTVDQVAHARVLLQFGFSRADVAKQVGASYGVIAHLQKGHTWKGVGT